MSVETRVLDKFKRMCYCASGDGTFYGKIEDERCAWCEASIIVKKEFARGQK